MPVPPGRIHTVRLGRPSAISTGLAPPGPAGCDLHPCSADAQTVSVAVGRFIRLRTDGDIEEVACTVTDAWQRRGVGTLLISTLVIAALALDERDDAGGRATEGQVGRFASALLIVGGDEGGAAALGGVLTIARPDPLGAGSPTGDWPGRGLR